MAKSKIILDLANSSVDTMTALKRAKVLLLELGNDKLLEWVNCEIAGYPSDAELPEYRVVQGNLMGSYFKGSMANHMKWNNVSLPLGKMPDEIRDRILNVSFHEGVDALKKLLESADDEERQLGATLPAEFFPIIAKCNNDPYMNIISARVVIGSQFVQNIFSVIENKLLDIFMILEKGFGNLDSLDIDVSGKSEEELHKISERMVVVIYNDNRVTVGNGNKIKDSNIASSIK
ncbi:hypothetical conserved protein [Roseburia sp. CAG:303]|nr:hypothetical conserved protein [Roseburia sp. CAG:303]